MTRFSAVEFQFLLEAVCRVGLFAIAVWGLGFHTPTMVFAFGCLIVLELGTVRRELGRIDA